MVPFYENKDEYLLFRRGNRLNFATHLHNHIELVYMLEGETLTYVNNHKAILKKGDIFISFPNQIHQFISKGPEKYLIFIFSPELLKEMSPILKNYIPVSQVIENAYKHPFLFNCLSSLATSYESNSKYRDIQIKGYLFAFFAELLKIMKLQKINTANLSMLQNILIYCSENYTENLSLDTIADSLHVSKYYVSHLLKKKINLGFSDYVNSIRISEACRYLLYEDKTITDICYLVGFNTIRTFNRAFFKQMGMSPSTFKKSNSYHLDY